MNYADDHDKPDQIDDTVHDILQMFYELQRASRGTVPPPCFNCISPQATIRGVTISTLSLGHVALWLAKRLKRPFRTSS